MFFNKCTAKSADERIFLKGGLLAYLAKLEPKIRVHLFPDKVYWSMILSSLSINRPRAFSPLRFHPPLGLLSRVLHFSRYASRCLHCTGTCCHTVLPSGEWNCNSTENIISILRPPTSCSTARMNVASMLREFWMSWAVTHTHTFGDLAVWRVDWTILTIQLTFCLSCMTCVSSLWPPYVIGGHNIFTLWLLFFFLSIFFMVALCNRADHYIFAL